MAEGRDVLFDIDWQGHAAVREKAARDIGSIFVLPPTIPDLERRLATAELRTMEQVIQARMAKAADEE